MTNLCLERNLAPRQDPQQLQPEPLRVRRVCTPDHTAAGHISTAGKDYLKQVKRLDPALPWAPEVHQLLPISVPCCARCHGARSLHSPPRWGRTPGQCTTDTQGSGSALYTIPHHHHSVENQTQQRGWKYSALPTVKPPHRWGRTPGHCTTDTQGFRVQHSTPPLHHKEPNTTKIMGTSIPPQLETSTLLCSLSRSLQQFPLELIQGIEMLPARVISGAGAPTALLPLLSPPETRACRLLWEHTWDGLREAEPSRFHSALHSQCPASPVNVLAAFQSHRDMGTCFQLRL